MTLTTKQRQQLYDREKAYLAIRYLYAHHRWVKECVRVVARGIARLPYKVIRK